MKSNGAKLVGLGLVAAGCLAAGAVEETVFNGMKYFGSPNDWISVRLQGYSAEELPAIYADGSTRWIAVRHEVPDMKDVRGLGRGYPFILRGEITVKIRSWDGSFEAVVGSKQATNWSYGQEMGFPLDTKDLKPGAYVVTAELPPHIRAEGVFNPTNTGTGRIGMSMLYGRNAMRLAVFENVRPENIFGVGNGMVHMNWWKGYDLANTLEARDLKPVLLGDGDAFHNALVGCPGSEGVFIDERGPTNCPAINNPVAKMLDIFSEPGRAELRRRAEEMGRRLGRNAGVAAVKLGNESPFFNRGAVCPTEAADASFRGFCRARYNDDLAALKAAWGRNIGSWDDVRQPIYDSGEAEVVEREGAAAVDWYANMGRMGKRLVKYLNEPENLAMAMDWYRWRTKESIRMYADYAAEAKKYDRKTVYSNNYCWPNFFAHLTLPTWRRLDGAMLDCQYVCTFPRTLGSNAEMIEILEMTESAMKDKAIIGREIYVQPHYPAEMVAMQNWAMVAHGVRANLVFGWKPYSDNGPRVFKDGPKAWLRPKDAKPMWMLIDTDGTRLPVYYGVKRSAEEIAAFHGKYNGVSIKRTRGRVAVYLSDETSMYTMLKTGDAPYADAVLCHTRDWLANELRLAGVRIEYLDDETVGELTRKDFDVVVIPPMPYVAEAPAAQLAAFEKAGGKVIRLAGKDPELIGKHPELPRSAWFEPADGGKLDVEVVVRTQRKTGRRFVFVLNRGKATEGVLSGTDFAGVGKLTDALTGETCGTSLSLGDYGYRILILP